MGESFRGYSIRMLSGECEAPGKRVPTNQSRSVSDPSWYPRSTAYRGLHGRPDPVANVRGNISDGSSGKCVLKDAHVAALFSAGFIGLGERHQPSGGDVQLYRRQVVV
jgi:hypothetical protein